MVLNLQISLYGQAEEPIIWNEKLKTGLDARRFNNSGVDPCLLISYKVIYVAYIDECKIFAIYQN